MIYSDAGLEMTRRQLQLAESILQGYRRDFLPHNPVQYHLFSGTTIDLIRSLRADIEDYLGIVPDTDLSISLEGEGVSLGQTAAGIITRSVDAFRRGLQSVVGILHAASTSRNGNGRADWIERLCELSLVGIGTSSVQVFLDLPTGTGRFPDEDDQFLDTALTTLFDGLEWAAQEDEAIPPSLERLSPTTRRALLGVVARLLPPQTGPVERIVYRRRPCGPGRPPRQATLTRPSRQRVHCEMERLADRKFTSVEGVIRQIDLDAQTFVLRERPNQQFDLPCEYPDDLADTVKALLDRKVSVSGLLETSRVTRKSKLEAEAIELLGEVEAAAEMRNTPSVPSIAGLNSGSLTSASTGTD